MTAGATSGDRFRSWPEILANAARAAEGLRALGVAEHDSVAQMLRNDFATFEINMAAGQLGAYAGGRRGADASRRAGRPKKESYPPESAAPASTSSCRCVQVRADVVTRRRGERRRRRHDQAPRQLLATPEHELEPCNIALEPLATLPKSQITQRSQTPAGKS
jgi:hypothetical protein